LGLLKINGRFVPAIFHCYHAAGMSCHIDNAARDGFDLVSFAGGCFYVDLHCLSHFNELKLKTQFNEKINPLSLYHSKLIYNGSKNFRGSNR
jgi:hypothetical protein